jgi:hypothetical protein
MEKNAIGIAIDLGYFQVKAKRDNREVEFNSLARRVPPASVITNFTNGNSAAVKVESGTYYIGENAINQGSVILKPLNDEWYTTDIYKLLLLNAIAQLVSEDEADEVTVKIVTGLPLKQLKAGAGDAERLKQCLIGQHWIETKRRLTINIETVDVYPQGINAFLYVMREDGIIPKNFLVDGVSIKGQKVAGIDAGSNNTQFYTLWFPNSFVMEKCGTIDYGYWQVYDKIAREINKIHNRNYKPHQMIQAERNQTLRISGNPVSIVDIVQKARQEYIEVLIDEFSRIWKQEDVDETALFTASGGGSNVLFPELHQRFTQAKMTTTPHYDNVNHYHRRLLASR